MHANLFPKVTIRKAYGPSNVITAFDSEWVMPSAYDLEGGDKERERERLREIKRERLRERDKYIER
jgi:hypothetical protein